MGTLYVPFVLAFLGSTVLAYLPHAKETFIPDAFLREVVDRMGRDLADAADAYLDFPDSNRMPLGALMAGQTEEQQFPLDYDHLAEIGNPSPSIRDQEYLQHSTLWGHQQGGGTGDHIGSDSSQQVKTDAALPAYCNPPNPCPIGHGPENGCLKTFENTASFSRQYQAEQDCMCDSEHMFDCPAPGSDAGSDSRGSRADSELERLVEQFTVEDQHKSLVAKKYHVKKDGNPYLQGERLPVAAKKGNHVLY